jgi:hypothetical protein
MTGMLPFLLALSCKQPEPVEAATTDDTGTIDTGEGPFLLTDDGTETWSTEDLTTAADEAIAFLWEIDPLVLYARYEEMMSEGDDDCPAWSEEGTWSGYCTTSSGLQIDGSAELEWSTDFMEKDTQIDHSIRLKADARFTTSDGATLMMRTVESRYDEYTNTGKYGKHKVTALLEGDFGWSDTSVDDSWLRHSARLEFQIQTGTGVAPSTLLDGTISGLPGTWIDALTMDNIYFDANLPDDGCTEEPSGALSLHTTDMQWYDLHFHGSGTESKYDGDACDGCADAYKNGVAVGAVCPDWSLWASWEDRPW